MIFLKTQEEIELLRESNQLVGKTLGEVSKHIRPGISTLELDKIAEDFIRSNWLAFPVSRVWRVPEHALYFSE